MLQKRSTNIVALETHKANTIRIAHVTYISELHLHFPRSLADGFAHSLVLLDGLVLVDATLVSRTQLTFKVLDVGPGRLRAQFRSFHVLWQFTSTVCIVY